MTLNLVPKNWSSQKDYLCEIWKLYDLPFDDYGQC